MIKKLSTQCCSIILVSLIFSGCMMGPDFQTPTPPNTSGYHNTPLPNQTAESKNSAGNAQSFRMGQNIPAQWWTLFRNKPLNALIAQGIENSPTLEAAKAATKQAQDALRAEIGAGLFPSINAQLAATHENYVNSRVGNNFSSFNLYNISANVSYNLDLFGAERRYLEALRAKVDYQAFQWQAAYLTLSANIVTTAIMEASLKAQVQQTEALIHSQENQFNITQQQMHLGGASQIDVLAQQTQLAQMRTTLPPLQKNLSQYQNALAVLVGKFPGNAKLPMFSLDDLKLPGELPVSLPSQLTQQRPDIRASEALLHQASANVGIAKANRFPQISLNGAYAYSNTQNQNLFGPRILMWNLGGQLTQTIFDAGSLKAKQSAAIATYQQAAAQYKQTVLQAFQNVADTLYAIQIDATALKEQVSAENTARATYSLVQKQYRLGATSYLALLDAERQYQQTKMTRIQAQAARYADTAALFQALGGGWWTATPAKNAKLAS